MNGLYYFYSLLFFLFLLHIVCEKFPVILTYVKYNKNGKSVRYTVLVLNRVVFDSEYLLWDQEDKKVILFLYMINHIVNMNIRIL